MVIEIGLTTVETYDKCIGQMYTLTEGHVTTILDHMITT